MSILTFCQWLQNTPGGTAIRESIWLFPIIESIHCLGILSVAGTILAVDLRLLGLGLRREPVSSVVQQVVPWTLTGFAFMFLSGSLLVWSEAVKCYNSLFFRIKLVLLLLAGLNALIFHFTVYRKVDAWDSAPAIPPRARLAGLLSLTLWICVIAAGRAIGYEMK